MSKQKDFPGLKQFSRHETGLSQAMMMIATGAPLQEILTVIVRNIEAEHPGMLCSILLLGRDGIHFEGGAAPSLPESYTQAVEKAIIGPNMGSCGTSVYLGKRIIVADIQSDPLWKDYKGLAAQANLNACWSEPVRAANGKILGSFAIYHRTAHVPSETDVETIVYAAQIASIAIERKRTEEALSTLVAERSHLLELEKRARALAERANQTKDEFIATLSHELRTPLTTILSWVQMLRSGRLDAEKTQRGLELLEKSTQAQAKLIDDLLDISRIQSGKINLELKKTDPVQVVKAAIDLTRNNAASKKIQIQLEATPSSKCIIVDPFRLQQIIWNLLINAIKFSPVGEEIQVKVDWMDSATGDQLRVQVRDHGKGIAPQFLPMVFDRFTQADSATTRAHGGMGLGLALVKKLVEVHEGKVEAASAGEDRGSVFTVTLPAKVSVIPKPPVNDEVAPKIMDVLGRSMVGLKVLLVEDEANAREAFKIILESDGAEVNAVASVSEALATIESFSPNLLVSDIAMPIEDGYSLIRKVRALPSEVSRIPALALTAYAGERDIESAMKAGFNFHLAKPVDSDRLIHKIVQMTHEFKSP